MTNHHPECDFDPRANRWACDCELLRERDRKRNDRAKQAYTYSEQVVAQLLTGPDINDSQDSIDQQVAAVMDYLKTTVTRDVMELFHFKIEFFYPR
jgi:hypothetical protein